MVSTECFKGLPFEYESFLVEKYDSCVTTCRYIAIFHASRNHHYMLIREKNNLMDVIIYDCREETVTCLNSLSYLTQDTIDVFTNHIFNNYPNIKTIEFPSSYSSLIADRSILTLRSDDFIISLPASMDDYFKQLGSSTRANVKKHKNKFLKEYPHANFVTKRGDEIERGLIDRIINLNFNRITSKGEVPNTNSSHIDNFHQYSQHYGFVACIEVDGSIIAGSIAYMSNKSMYSYFLAHDNNYSNYNAGQLCMLYLIQTSIENGFTEFHLLWGESEYKTRFLAKPRTMYSYIVFKSLTYNFILNKTKEYFSHKLYDFKKSKYAIPIRSALKYFKKKTFKQLSKLQYLFLLFLEKI